MDKLHICHSIAVTALGLDAPTTCAASRAGLSRAGSAEYFPIGSPDEVDQVEYANVHSIPVELDGFQSIARLQMLLSMTVNNIAREILRDLDANTVPLFYFVLPHPYRQYRGLSAVQEDLDDDLLELEGLIEEDASDFTHYNDAIKKILDSIDWPSEPQIRSVSYSDTCGVAECVNLARRELAGNRSDLLGIIISVDTLVSAETLEWLSATSRLKSSLNPVGLQPGEAGSAFTLATDATLREKGFRSLGTINGVSVANTGNSRLKGEPIDSESMTTVVKTVLNDVSEEEFAKLWLISDHAGEEYRANEFGAMLHLLRGNKVPIEAGEIWYPAVSVGYVGGAFGGIALCFVLASFNRGYNPSQMAVILTASDDVHRAAFLVGPGSKG